MISKRVVCIGCIILSQTKSIEISKLMVNLKSQGKSQNSKLKSQKLKANLKSQKLKVNLKTQHSKQILNSSKTQGKSQG